MSQVEFEYKGRNGQCGSGLINQVEALQEMDLLGQRLCDHTGEDILQPTRLTKFDWIIRHLLQESF